jgi:hypothetical protein
MPRLRKNRDMSASRQDPVMTVRLASELRTNVDKWAAEQSDRLTQAEAICRLLELGLAASRPMKRRNPKAVSKASAMAGQQIDKLADSSVTDEERQRRKRRLLKGPTEFRDIRGDISKSKG